MGLGPAYAHRCRNQGENIPNDGKRREKLCPQVFFGLFGPLCFTSYRPLSQRRALTCPHNPSWARFLFAFAFAFAFAFTFLFGSERSRYEIPRNRYRQCIALLFFPLVFICIQHRPTPIYLVLYEGMGNCISTIPRIVQRTQLRLPWGRGHLFLKSYFCRDRTQDPGPGAGGRGAQQNPTPQRLLNDYG